MISNWKQLFGLYGLYKNIPAHFMVKYSMFCFGWHSVHRVACDIWKKRSSEDYRMSLTN